MTVMATAIDLTQWTDDELRDDVRRCMTALWLLTHGSPARVGLARVIASIVARTASPVTRRRGCHAVPVRRSAHFP